jgi:hypothetical protein
MSGWVYIVSCVLLSVIVSGDEGYSAPPTGYGPPAEAYGVPETAYAPPATGYGATGPSYTATGGGGDDLLDLAKLEELAPLFLAVFAAIILANLLGPLISALFTVKTNLVSPLIAPIGAAKGSLVNLILGVFQLQLCDLNGNAFPGTGRDDVAAEWNINPALLDILSGKVTEAIHSYSS